LTLISRYILREVVVATAVVLLVLMVILMSNQFAAMLGDAAGNRIPREALFVVFGLSFMSYLTLLAPISLLLGIMLALARLNRDSEMAAISACGIGPARLLVPIGTLVALLVAIVGWLSLVQTPEATRQIDEITAQAARELELNAVEAGKFTSPDGGRTVIYAAEVDGDRLRDVFLQREEEGRLLVIVADRGERMRDPQTGALSVVLYDGWRYEGVPGDPEVSFGEFGENGIPVGNDVDNAREQPIEARTTTSLIYSGAVTDRAELEWRISTPVSLIVLALIALPLSRSTPRQGRYARVGTGLLVYLCYANSLTIARTWMERGQTPEWAGMWWVHAVVAALALVLLARYAGWFAVRRSLKATDATAA
jgi:lipopolysaccharide export system permease protein